MPFYTWLRPYPYDDVDILATKLRAAQKIKALRAAIEAHINAAELAKGTELPSDTSRFVRIATWNLREFDSPSYGHRSLESIAYIAEIISYFDLIALQEIRHDLHALGDLKNLLGPNWDYIATDVTESSSGNTERMAFLFNREKVWFRNVAGELALPMGQKVTDSFGDHFKVEGGAQFELPTGQVLESPKGLKTQTLASGQTKIEEDVEIPFPAGTKIVLPQGSSVCFPKNARVPISADGSIDIEATATPKLPESGEIVLPPNSLLSGPKHFARTPFVTSFQAGWMKINLAIVHIYYGTGAAGIERRKDEIRRLTALLADRAKSDSDSDADSYFIVLGDFNCFSPEHEMIDALRSNEFLVPEPLQRIHGSNVKQYKFYDQIALWTGESSHRKKYTRIIPYRAGVFDFFEVVYRMEEEDTYRPFMRKPNSDDFYTSYASWRTFQMSDHLPMWVELHIDFSRDYLDEIEADIRAHIDR
ncbi:MAG: endonuclease/exonuclease/phosphatase family protein [Desulfobacterales bacterium]